MDAAVVGGRPERSVGATDVDRTVVVVDRQRAAHVDDLDAAVVGVDVEVDAGWNLDLIVDRAPHAPEQRARRADLETVADDARRVTGRPEAVADAGDDGDLVGFGAGDDDAPIGVVDVDHRHAFGVDHLGDGPDFVGEEVDDVERAPAEGSDREHAAGRQPGGLRCRCHESFVILPTTARPRARGGGPRRSGQAELREDVADVLLDGLVADDELPAIAGLVRPSAISDSTSRSRGDSGASGSRRRDPGEELGDHLGVERRAAGADPPDGGEELARRRRRGP